MSTPTKSKAGRPSLPVGVRRVLYNVSVAPATRAAFIAAAKRARVSRGALLDLLAPTLRRFTATL